MPLNTPLRILIVEDHPTTRLGLTEAVNAQDDMRVVGEAATWHGAASLVQETSCDVLLLDLSLPDGNGWTLLEQLQSLGRLPPTLVLSICDEHIYASRLLRSGARGYLMKDEPLARILDGIRQVHAGHMVTSSAISTRLMQQALGAPAPETATPVTRLPGGHTLSDRELQVFTLLGKGMRNKEAAVALGVSEKTIATYKVRLMEKLQVSSTPQLIERFRTWSE